MHQQSDNTIAAILADEIVRDSPGQQTVLDRLLDVLVVDTLRTWYEQQGERVDMVGGAP